MTALFITPMSAITETVRRHRVSHLVTLIDPQTPVPTPDGIAGHRHLRLDMDDIVQPVEGRTPPSSDHVAQILNFSKNWQRDTPLLVHCWAGISRSTAAAFILLCDLHGPGHEDAIARGLRFRAPHAQPNRLIIQHADRLMGRDGRMIAAVESMGMGRVVWEGEIVEMPLSLDEL